MAQAILDAPSEQMRLGAWRCFLAFDRMIFGELRDGGDNEQKRSVADRLSARLQDFWAGRWGNLMSDTAKLTSSSPPSSSEARTVRKVRQLLLKGEISKAAAATWGRLR